MNFQYPIRNIDDISFTAEELTASLTKEETGHYLLGNHQFWHGGVHFTDKTAPQCITEMPIRCIADGKVIAYRINENYKDSIFTTRAACYNLKYSTSFCLVKHEYISPTEPVKPEEKKTPTTNSGWVNRTVVLGSNRTVRNPSAINDTETTCIFSASLPTGSKLKIIEVNETMQGENNYYYAKAQIIFIAEAPTQQGQRVTTLINSKNANDGGKKIGDEIYFAAFDNNGVIKNGNSDIFSDAPPKDWTSTTNITTETDYTARDLPLSSPNTIITVPKGTKLEILEVQDKPIDNLIYAKAKATCKLVAIKVADGSSSEFPENTEMWIAITDQFGNIETIKEEGKDKEAIIDSTPKPEPKTNKLTFFSLYMHLLPYQEYDALQNIQPVKQYFRTTTRLTARATPSSSASSRGSIAAKTIFEVSEIKESTVAGEYSFAKGQRCNSDGKIVQGAQEVWFATGINAKDNQPAASYTESYTPPLANKQQTKPAYWNGNAIIKATTKAKLNALQLVEDEATINGIINKIQVVILQKEMNPNCVFEFDNTKIIQQKIARSKSTTQSTKEYDIQEQPVVQCTFKSGTCSGKNSLLVGETFWLVMNENTLKAIEQQATPKIFDNVIPCNIDIKAGDPIGYLGQYDTLASPEGGVNSKHQLHFEIFTNDDKAKLDSFLNNEAGLTIGKQFLRIRQGATIHFADKPDNIKNVPLSSPVMPTPTIASLQRNTVAAADSCAVPYNQVMPLDKAETSLTKDKAGIEWYRVSILDQRQSKSGWIQKNSSYLEKIGQHDWKKLGFTVIEETNGYTDDAIIDLTKDPDAIRNYYDSQDATVHPYLVSADIEDTTKATRFFESIYSEIDQLGNGNDIVTPNEVQQALADPALAEKIQKIIGYHPTEWQAKSDHQKWETLKQILETEEDRPLLKHELERIDNLVFWDEVPELKGNPKVYHFHPIAFIKYINMAIASYHIYADGKIEKHIPFLIADGFKNKYRYIYHDAKEHEYHICDLDWHTVKEKYSNGYKANSNEKSHYTHQPVESNTAVSDGDTRRRVIYTNGDVAEFGKHDTHGYNTWRLFSVKSNDVEMVKMLDALNYKNGDIKIEYSFSNSKRRYVNAGLFAAILGSIAEYGKKVTTTGSAFYWGSCFPSTNHINGMSIDFTYKSRISSGSYYLHNSQEYKDDLAFLNAMRKFFKLVLVGSHSHFKEFRALSNVGDGGGLHNSHFHAEFSLSKVKEIKE